MSPAEKRILELEKENADLKQAAVALKQIQEEKDRIEKDYRDSQTRFHTVFQESTLGKKIINEHLEILHANPALLKILGFEANEVIGKKIIEFTHPDFVEEWEKLRKELWLSSDPRTSFSIETCLIRKNKTQVWCQVTSILIEDAGKRLGYTLVEDINIRKEKERIKEELVEREHILQLKEQEQMRQKELFESIVRTQEEERERIAEQLHNSLGQMLYAVKIQLSLVKFDSPGTANHGALAEANRLLSQSITECRRTAHHLLPRILNDFGLREAIDDLGNQFRPAIKFDLHFESLVPIKEKYAEIIIFRTVQELLLNIVKHAEATEASCKVEIDKKSISIIVEDNGKGFKPEDLRKNGIGLSAMKSRIEQMEGSFDISSAAPKGTRVTVTFPRRKF